MTFKRLALFAGIFFLCAEAAAGAETGVSPAESESAPPPDGQPEGGPPEQARFPAMPLPIFPALESGSLGKSGSGAEKAAVPSITWEIDRQQGVQIISRIPGTRLFAGEGDAETVFPVNNYKSVMLTVHVFDFFILHSDLTAGFSRDNTPFDFSIDTIPYLYHDWTSAETNVYITRRVCLPHNLWVYPFAGYIFSQFHLQNIFPSQEAENLRLQTLTAGAKVTFRPSRIVSMDYGLSFSPVIMLNYNDMLLFQIGYEAAIRVETGFLAVSAVLNTRNNIEYSAAFLGADTVRVSEIGLRFKLVL